MVLDRTELGEWKTFIETVMWEVAGTKDVAVLRLDEGADFDLNPLAPLQRQADSHQARHLRVSDSHGSKDPERR